MSDEEKDNDDYEEEYDDEETNFDNDMDSYRRLESMLDYFIENEINNDSFSNNQIEDNFILYSTTSRRNNLSAFSFTNNLIDRRIHSVETSSSILFMDSLYDSVIDSIMNESFETQLISEKNDALDLKVLVYDEIHNEEKECSICLSEFEKDSKVSLISCNHLFHNECIKEWSMYKQNCPICRKKIE